MHNEDNDTHNNKKWHSVISILTADKDHLLNGTFQPSTVDKWHSDCEVWVWINIIEHCASGQFTALDKLQCWLLSRTGVDLELTQTVAVVFLSRRKLKHTESHSSNTILTVCNPVLSCFCLFIIFLAHKCPLSCYRYSLKTLCHMQW